MPEIESELVFRMVTDNIALHTQVNGDTLVLSKIHFAKEEAGTLAWLINHPVGTSLEVQIKKV